MNKHVDAIDDSKIRSVIVISDTHCGCRFGLCPPSVQLDHGGRYHQGPTQQKIWEIWNHFWNVWVPEATRGEPYAIVHNGDAIDGSHHGSKTQISQNHSDQANIAYEALAPLVEKSGGRFYMVRGTEAHTGQSEENGERLARRLGAVKEEYGHHSRYEMWMRVGHGLCHFTHHIGTTSRTAYETSALMAEYSEMLTDAGRWGREAPDVVVRSHRHRMCKVEVPTAKVYGIVFTTPAWQAKTPFVWKVARVGEPQLGGALIRCGDEELYTRHYTQALGRSQVHHLEMNLEGEEDEADS